MTDLLKNNIETKIGRRLSVEEFDHFSALLVEKEFSRNAFLTRENKLCTEIFFIQKGACYSFLSSESGESQVVQLAMEDYWISDLYGFFSGSGAIFSIKAIETTKVFSLSVDKFSEACLHIPIFERFFRILLQNAYVNQLLRMSKTAVEDAESRYTDFVKKNPEAVNRFPQYLIASYLRMKPESLSRIRRQLTVKR